MYPHMNTHTVVSKMRSMPTHFKALGATIVAALVLSAILSVAAKPSEDNPLLTDEIQRAINIQPRVELTEAQLVADLQTIEENVGHSHDNEDQAQDHIVINKVIVALKEQGLIDENNLYRGDQVLWWEIDDYNIVLPAGDGLYIEIPWQETDSDNLFATDFFLDVHEVIRKELSDQGFSSNKENSSDSVDDKSKVYYNQAYENDKLYCLAATNPIRVEEPLSELRGEVAQVYFTCYSSSSADIEFTQKQAYLDLTDKRGTDQALGGFREVNDHLVVLNGYTKTEAWTEFFYNLNGEARYIGYGPFEHKAPACGLLEENNIPYEHTFGCLLENEEFFTPEDIAPDWVNVEERE